MSKVKHYGNKQYTRLNIMATTNIQGLTLRQQAIYKVKYYSYYLRLLPISKVKHYCYYQYPRLNITAITNVQG